MRSNVATLRLCRAWNILAVIGRNKIGKNMAKQITKIDKHGRIELPKEMREMCGLLPETDVLIEVKEDGIFIKPRLAETPVTQKIAEMDLPVAGWEEMEKEIEAGHLK